MPLLYSIITAHMYSTVLYWSQIHVQASWDKLRKNFIPACGCNDLLWARPPLSTYSWWGWSHQWLSRRPPQPEFSPEPTPFYRSGQQCSRYQCSVQREGTVAQIYSLSDTRKLREREPCFGENVCDMWTIGNSIKLFKRWKAALTATHVALSEITRNWVYHSI